MLALEPQFLKLDEIDEIPIDTDFELEWTCSSKVGLVDVEIYLLNYLVNSYTDIDAQDKSATIKVEEGDFVDFKVIDSGGSGVESVVEGVELVTEET